MEFKTVLFIEFEKYYVNFGDIHNFLLMSTYMDPKFLDFFFFPSADQRKKYRSNAKKEIIKFCNRHRKMFIKE